MALFDTPRIFKTPAEEANEAASRVSALGLGQLFAHAFEGAQARAQHQLQFEEQMAQRKIEYQNNLDRLKQQQQLETDKWELGKKLENLQINQLQNKIDEDKAFADDLTVFQSWQKTLNEDPWAPVPLESMKSDKGKELLINWRQQKINQNVQMLAQMRNQTMENRLTEEGAAKYWRLKSRLSIDAANGITPNFKELDDFWDKAESNGWVLPYDQTRWRPTQNALAADYMERARIARDNGDDDLADRLETYGRTLANASKELFPPVPRPTVVETASQRAEVRAAERVHDDDLNMAMGDAKEIEAANKKFSDELIRIKNKYSGPPIGGTQPIKTEVTNKVGNAVFPNTGQSLNEFQKKMMDELAPLRKP